MYYLGQIYLFYTFRGVAGGWVGVGDLLPCRSYLLSLHTKKYSFSQVANYANCSALNQSKMLCLTAGF